jgi:hypothetical protein
MLEVMCCDYGYRTGVERMYSDGDGAVPKSGLALAVSIVRRCSTFSEACERIDCAGVEAVTLLPATAC